MQGESPAFFSPEVFQELPVKISFCELFANQVNY